MTPQELINSILQLAIQGKLVEQRSEEGTGEELYQRIQEEKKTLIKSCGISKGRKALKFWDDCPPFVIPKSWKWVCLGDVTILNPKNEIEENLDVGFIPMPHISDGFRSKHTFDIRKWKEIKKGYTHFADNDIGIAKITPCFQNRKSVIFKDLPSGYGAGTTELTIIRIVNDTLLREYLLWFCKSDYFIRGGIKSFTGTAGQQRIHKDYLATCYFPLPPIAEQKRIVAKIEELLPYIDRYEKAWSRLEDFNKRFPVDMQKSILQMAIQGKLVEQRPEEGTGEELFQQIQAEKQKLIKEGKIIKEKPLPEISEDEIPFDIPESWKWVHMSSILDVRDGTHDTPKYVQKGVPLVTSKNLQGGVIDFNAVKMISLEDAETIDKRSKVDDGDILFAMIGTIGNPVLVKKEREFCIKNMALFKPVGSNKIDMKYVLFFLSKAQADMKKMASASVQSFVSLSLLRNYLFPLPPLAEQKRIVAKLEEILPLCERLK